MTTYTFNQALDIIEEIQQEFDQGLLETLIYMQSNLEDFSDREREAYRVVFRNMRKLFI